VKDGGSMWSNRLRRAVSAWAISVASTVTSGAGCANISPNHNELPVAFREPHRAAGLNIRLAFDTGPGWWTDPNKECPQWDAALPIARRMAGCSADYVGDLAHKCQAIIRKCSPGCDLCRNLKPGDGPDTDFGSVLQPFDGPAYARTIGPGLFGGHYTRFDRVHACGNAILLAKVMVHEAAHACRGAGGSKTLYDSDHILRLGSPGCYAEQIAPFKPESNRECGDPL